MAKHWRYIMFIIWLSYLITSGILMYTRGFLLSRDAFMDKSECTSNSTSLCAPSESTSVNITNGYDYYCTHENKILQNLHSASKICFSRKTKVILLVIDALRYDFATYDPDLKEPFPFQNKLPVINELLTNSKNAKLYKFIADPPTTTMQRLKGLTTGGLPTFIDAGSNFASPEINEDNIIDQIISNNKSIVFLGDDTWLNLYPNRFIRTWPFPSFNVFDLDTVDNGIINHLYTEISKSDWSFLIAHFLGVDHCGHRYGPYHKEMERKLTEMNEVIRKTANIMDNDTVLFVIGDHGMTNTGDHGGESDLEVTSTLFIYSSLPLVSFESDKNIDSVKQIDLVPTLSYILGVPIPFSNLGAIIFESFLVVNDTENALLDWQQALLALWSNVQQTSNYINRYAESSSQLKSENLELIRSKFSLLNAKVHNVKNKDDFISFTKEAKNYLRLLRETCEEVWIQFDSFSMSRGLLIVFLTIFFVYMIIDGISSNKLVEILFSSFLICAYVLIAITIIICFICYRFALVDNFELTVYFSTGVLSIVLLSLLVIQNWEAISMHWYESTKIKRWLNYIYRIILLLFLCTLFSNSYIVEEASVLAYLSLALIFFIAYNTISRTNTNKTNITKLKWNSQKTKLLFLCFILGILIRLSMLYWRCREEQKWCNFNMVNTQENLKYKDGEKIQFVVTLVILSLFVTITKIWLRSCGNLTGFSPTVIVARYTPAIIVVCSAGFWVLHRLPKETKTKLVAVWQVDMLAWTVYALIIFDFFIIIIQPLCIYILPKKNQTPTTTIYGQGNIIPQLFNHVKEMYKEKKNENLNSKEMPVVYGLATVYSASFIIVSILICLLVVLLLGDKLAPSIVIMYFTAMFTLIVISVAQYEGASNITELFEVPSTSVLCWVLLSHYFFYGTGHQPSFPSIHWDAAFVGTGGNFVTNVIPATLIGINTFGSYIFMAFILPLLIIGPFTLYVMFPSILHTKANNKDLKRGEFQLYEHENKFRQGIFNLFCKYILLHGLRIFACMLATTIHCRHLMVWSIFAPKLIFEGLAMMVTLSSTILSYLLLNLIHSRVDKLIIRLEKQNR